MVKVGPKTSSLHTPERPRHPNVTLAHLSQFDVGSTQLLKQLSQHCLWRVQLTLQDLLLYKCGDSIGCLQASDEAPGTWCNAIVQPSFQQQQTATAAAEASGVGSAQLELMLLHAASANVNRVCSNGQLNLQSACVWVNSHCFLVHHNGTLFAPVSIAIFDASCTRSCSCFCRFCACSGVKVGCCCDVPANVELELEDAEARQTTLHVSCLCLPSLLVALQVC